MADAPWTIRRGDSPVVATAIHDGHEVRPEVARLMALDEAARLREEDPGTGRWTEVAPTAVVPRRSRFEVDLNRPREKAVYLTPDDSWGLQVWFAPPPVEVVDEALALYDAFYAEIERLLTEVVDRHGHFVLLDVHSYNHRRRGPGEPPDDPGANPDVNVGTGSLDRTRWGHLVDRFLADVAAASPPGRPLDVRENVRFRGGWLSSWVNATFAGRGCALALEYKKTFMDEWTGEFDDAAVGALVGGLSAAIPGLVETVAR